MEAGEGIGAGMGAFIHGGGWVRYMKSRSVTVRVDEHRSRGDAQYNISRPRR